MRKHEILIAVFSLLIATSTLADGRSASDISSTTNPEEILKHAAAERVMKECVENTLKRSRDIYELILQGGPDTGLTINIVRITCYAESLRRNDGLISAPTADMAPPKQ